MKTKQFVRMDFDIIRSKELALLFNNEFTLYLYLRSYIVRNKYWNGYFNMKETFYDNGLLVSRWSQHDLAEHFEVKQPCISKWISKLKKKGFIEVVKRNKNGKNYTFYVLGTVNTKTKEEKVYMDHIIKKNNSINVLKALNIEFPTP